MAEKKYVGVEALIRLVAQVKTGFASMVHKHEIKDIEDYVVDAALSDTSTNPVENRAIQAEFQTIADVLTSKADKSDLTNGSFVVKNAEHADTTDLATNAQNATKATQDASGNVITSTYETKTDASAKFAEAKSYADSAAIAVKNDLLNGAGEAYDTLKELGELIDTNVDAIDALETVAAGKADKEHTHTISEITDMPEVANADWNQNDPNIAGYVANRTHWIGEPVSEITLVENVSISTTEANNSVINPFNIDLTDEETYKVVWDNEIYECIAYKNNNDNLCIGATDSYGNNEPFLVKIISLGSDGSDVFVSATEAGDHTISIYKVVFEIHKLNVKYLPDGASIGAVGDGEGSEIFNDYNDNTASGEYSHAEGHYTTASGNCSHVEGYYTTASGEYSHAEGYNTIASGNYSHAEGYNTIAASDKQHVQGEYNIRDTSDTYGRYVHIVGNGTSSKRSNAHTLDWDGNAWYQGIVKVGGTSYDDATELLTNTPSSLVNLGMPATATVGQTAVVKAIDGNGMPIEWEAADLGKITIDENGDAWFGSPEEIYKIPEGLPDYTAEDEGKILSVVNGDAAWTENTGGSGGGGGIVVSETEPIDESVIFWVQI